MYKVLLVIVGREGWNEQKKAYLLILRSCSNDVVHQNGHEFSDPIDTSCRGAIWSSIANRLALLLGLFKPFSGDAVDNVQHAKLVGGRGFSEVGEDLLDKD